MKIAPAILVCTSALTVAGPVRAETAGETVLAYIDAAIYATEICPALRLDLKRVTEITQSLNVPPSSIARMTGEAQTALALPPLPEPSPEPDASTGRPAQPAINPACRVALANFGPAGAKLPGLLYEVSRDPAQPD
jgi:hypothetical protein